MRELDAGDDDCGAAAAIVFVTMGSGGGEMSRCELHASSTRALLATFDKPFAEQPINRGDGHVPPSHS